MKEVWLVFSKHRSNNCAWFPSEKAAITFREQMKETAGVNFYNKPLKYALVDNKKKRRYKVSFKHGDANGTQQSDY